MLETIKRYSLPTIIALSALSVSVSAAFYSVTGLSKLFAGASFEVVVMASALEVSKLVIASLLYRYWKVLNKLLRTYLTIAAIVLVLITSMGIYGFLSAAYQGTYRELTIRNNQISFLEQKKGFYQKDVDRFDQELERISENISTLSNARSQTIQVRDTTVEGGVRSTISTAELRLAQSRIDVEEQNRKDIQLQRVTAADSLQKYELQILDLQNSSDTANELGPLEYISGLTDQPMDKVINILLLVIIFVFDPLAISLVVAANFAFDKAVPKENLYGEKVYEKQQQRESIVELMKMDEEAGLYDTDWDTTLQDGLEELDMETTSSIGPTSIPEEESEEELDRRMNIIGKNGNDGLHYETLSEPTPTPLPTPSSEPKPITNPKPTPRTKPLKVIDETNRQYKVLYDNGRIEWIDKEGGDSDEMIRYL